MEELFKMLEEEMEGARIYIDSNGCRVTGELSAVLTLITKLFKGLKENGVEKKMLQETLDLAFMDEKEMNKKLLNELKEFLEKMQKQEEE